MSEKLPDELLPMVYYYGEAKTMLIAYKEETLEWIEMPPAKKSVFTNVLAWLCKKLSICNTEEE